MASIQICDANINAEQKLNVNGNVIVNRAVIVFVRQIFLIYRGVDGFDRGYYRPL